MKIKDIVKSLNLEVKFGNELLEREVTGGYVSDMLSDVIANARTGDIWVTLQTHLNIIAVAMMKEVSCVIIVNGRQPDDETLKKAKEEEIPVLGTIMNAFQVVGRLNQLGICACDEGI